MKIKIPSLSQPKPPNPAARIASHILLHVKYPTQTPKLPKSVLSSLPAVMR
jgi:hypothetical protein